MAKIKFGMMMTDARGKLGGQVFSKNRSGAYVRTKVTPVNPRTALQQKNRALLGDLSSNWSRLTESQRKQWNDAAPNWQKTNVFGDLTKPTGKNLFTGLNKILMQAFPEKPILAAPPAKQEISAVMLEVAVLNASSNGIYYLNFSGEVTTGTTFLIRATPNLTPGTSYYKNRLRSLGPAIAVDETGSLLFEDGYRSLFGEAIVGGNVYIEARQVLENGQLGVPAVVRASVV